jgi:hypothetical protein
MTKAKVQVDADYEAEDQRSAKSKRIMSTDAYRSMTQSSADLISEGIESGLEIVTGLTQQVSSQLETLAESTQSSLNFHFRMLRESINSCEQLSKIWIHHSLATFSSSINHTRTLGDKSTESFKNLVRIVKSDKA